VIDFAGFTARLKAAPFQNRGLNRVFPQACKAVLKISGLPQRLSAAPPKISAAAKQAAEKLSFTDRVRLSG
jgi:hypothetical protein